MRQSRQGALITALCVLLIPDLAHANGFRIPAASAAGVAAANALVADPVDVGATPYNPAAVAFHSGRLVSAGVVAIDRTLSVANSAGTTNSDTSNPSFVPNGFLELPLVKDWRWAIAFKTPYGQETNWPAGTFPAFAGQLAALAPTRSRIRLYNVSPIVAGKLTPALGIAAGLDYYELLEARLDSVGTRLEGDGHAIGWNFGLLYAASPWSFGVAYRSSAKIDIEGDFATPFASSSATTNVRLPAVVQAGARLELHPSWSAEVDVEYTNWETFDVLTIHHTNPTAPSPVISTNDWRDTFTYRVTLAYQPQPETTLRIGYAYEPSAVPDKHFSPRTPDPRSDSFSVGIGHTLADWRFDAGYMYVRYASRTFSTEVPFGTYAFDPNGTDVFNGTYRSKAHLFGLNVTRRF